jgi:hypothetical protein
MQQHIPDELGREISQLAAGLNLHVDAAIREALESWIVRARHSRSKRVPDPPILDDEAISVPFDLPRSASRSVLVTAGPRHVPDGLGLS